MDPVTRLKTSLSLRLRRRYVWLRQRVASVQRAGGVADAELDDVPIIATGCHRSGTSLVRRVLDSHPRIACPPETQFLEHLAHTITFAEAEKGYAGIGMTPDDAARQLGAVAESWLRAYADRKGKHRWAEKSPNVVQQLPGVDLLLGGRARFLLIVRDGMDVATSLGGGDWGVIAPWRRDESDPYLAACQYWVDMNAHLHAFAEAQPERTHLLRYDELIDDPEGQLRAVFAFLGEAWDPTVLDFNRKPHDSGWEDHTVSTTWTFEDNRGKHRALDRDLQARMWAIVSDTMQTLGYPERVY